MSTEPTLGIGSLTIPSAEQTPLALVEIIRRQDAEIKALRDEIHKLKGNTQRPKIEPSRLLKPPQKKSDKPGKRPGSQKRNKTAALPIHQDLPVVIEGLPEGTAATRFTGLMDVPTNTMRAAIHLAPPTMKRLFPSCINSMRFGQSI